MFPLVDIWSFIWFRVRVSAALTVEVVLYTIVFVMLPWALFMMRVANDIESLSVYRENLSRRRFKS